jgi:2-dehydropantoate 2-reductase
MILGIVGAGAMGTLLAQALAGAAEVRLLGHDGEAGAMSDVDYLLVAVKSYATVEALRRLRGVVNETTPLVSIQNGLDQLVHVDAALGPRQTVVLAPTTYGATLLGPGRVRRTGRGLVTLGWAQGRGAGILEPLGDLLIAGGLSAQIAHPIEPWVWAKLVANAAINPVTALAGVPNGAILEQAHLRARAACLARETALVAAAEGIALPFSDPVAYVEGVARTTAANRSSMLVDLERMRPTEIDALNGAVVRRGRLHGVKTPENVRALNEVRARTRA